MARDTAGAALEGQKSPDNLIVARAPMQRERGSDGKEK